MSNLLKVITGFFLFSLFNFQGPTRFLNFLLRFLSVALLSSARAIIQQLFAFVNPFFKVFLNFFRGFFSELLFISELLELYQTFLLLSTPFLNFFQVFSSPILVTNLLTNIYPLHVQLSFLYYIYIIAVLLLLFNDSIITN